MCQNDVPVGMGLLAHRGWTTRLAAMGIRPEDRHTGVGKWLLEQLIAGCKDRGGRFLTLEVITANVPALSLYQELGFVARRRLLGYRCDSPVGESCGPLEEIDVREVGRVLVDAEPPDMPRQISGETIGQLGPPARAFRLGDVHAVIEQHGMEMELIAIVAPSSCPLSWRRDTPS